MSKSMEKFVGGVLSLFFKAKEEDLLMNKIDLPNTLRVSSDEFKEGEPMPKKCSADAEELCPSLKIENVPNGTKSLVVVMQDADVPMPFPVVHMIRTNLVEHSYALGELDNKGKKGKAFMGRVKYAGPKPIVDHGPHRYYFEVFALNTDKDAEKADLAKVKELITEHGIAKGYLMGTYERRS